MAHKAPSEGETFNPISPYNFNRNPSLSSQHELWCACEFKFECQQIKSGKGLTEIISDFILSLDTLASKLNTTNIKDFKQVNKVLANLR